MQTKEQIFRFDRRAASLLGESADSATHSAVLRVDFVKRYRG